jgi:GNAT superfamily N-acetyltransferase
MTGETTDLQVSPVEPCHTEQVRELWNDRLGAPETAMDQWIQHGLNERRPTTVYVATVGSDVVGFGICTIGGAEWVDSYINHPDVTVSCWPDTGVIHSLAVATEYESQGIATTLVSWQLHHLTINDADGALAVSWHRENHYDSRPLFRKFGFEADAVIPDFYTGSTDDTYCVDCENGCECGSTVFTRNLPYEQSETQPTNYPQPD